MQPQDLADIERSTYRTAVDHGFWDIALGSILLIMGLSMALHMAYMVGVFTALAIPLWKRAQASVLEPRIGYVQLSPSRRKQIVRGVCIAVLTMAPLILVPILIGNYMGWKLGRMPGVPAFLVAQLLAIPVITAGYLLELKRLYFYAALICAAMAAGYLAQIRFDGLIAATGLAIMCVGALVLRGFLHRYPMIQRGTHG